MLRLTLGIAALILVSGCDTTAHEPDTLPRTVRGTVVSLSTGQPLAGLTVDLRDFGAYGTYSVYDQTTTDDAGRFELRPGPGVADADLQVNGDFDTYDPYVYGWNSTGLGVPIQSEMRIELWEIADLVVYAETDTPLGPGDRAFIGTPCVGSIDSPTRAGCAKANAENEVTLTVTRDGETTTRRERIYTPLGETTVVRWTY